MNDALAYFITFSCYGTRLHGDDAGSVDIDHNQFGLPTLPTDNRRQRAVVERMVQLPYTLDAGRRAIVLATVSEVCRFRGWRLFAVHVRSTHVHVVVSAGVPPEKAMNDFKVYASRRLTETGYDSSDRRRWARHGSTRYLFDARFVRDAVTYVVEQQGEPMAVFSMSNEEMIAALGL